MAAITHAVDILNKTVDSSQGFPHTKQHVVGVELSIGLEAAEAATIASKVRGTLRQGGLTYALVLGKIFGPGAWQLSLDNKMLTVRLELRRNAYSARTTSRLAVGVLNSVNTTIGRLRDEG